MVKCLEIFGETYKSAKLWDVKVGVLEECDVEVVEKRGIDSGQKVLQIFRNASDRSSVRAGRISRVDGGKYWFVGSGRYRGERN